MQHQSEVDCSSGMEHSSCKLPLQSELVILPCRRFHIHHYRGKVLGSRRCLGSLCFQRFSQCLDCCGTGSSSYKQILRPKLVLLLLPQPWQFLLGLDHLLALLDHLREVLLQLVQVRQNHHRDSTFGDQHEA